MIWVATVAALVLLSLLIVFILQNQDLVQVQYLGLSGSLPLGVALFIAAVAGGLLVATAGAVRISQLRRTAFPTQRRAKLQHLVSVARNQALRHRHQDK